MSSVTPAQKKDFHLHSYLCLINENRLYIEEHVNQSWDL